MARSKNNVARKSTGDHYVPPKRKNPFFIQKSEKKQNLEKITQLILYDDLIIEILQFLDSFELKNFSLTSKIYYETVHSEEFFCKVLYQGITPQILKQFHFQGGLELIRKSPYLEHFQESYDHDEYFNHDLEFNVDSDGIYSFQIFEPISHNVTNFVDLFFITKMLCSIGNEIYMNDSEKALKFLGDIEFDLNPFIIDTKTIHKEVQVDIHDIRWYSIEKLKEIKIINSIRILEKLFYPQKCCVHSWDEFWKIQKKENQENAGLLKMKQEMESICQNLCYVNINTSSSSCRSEFIFFLGEFGQYLVGFYFFVKENLAVVLDKGFIFNDEGEKILNEKRTMKKNKFQ
jgi:hypothetical protein